MLSRKNLYRINYNANTHSYGIINWISNHGDVIEMWDIEKSSYVRVPVTSIQEVKYKGKYIAWEGKQTEGLKETYVPIAQV